MYGVHDTIDRRTHKCVASIGVRPTFDAGLMSVEVYLFDYAGDLYGKQKGVSFGKRLRGEEKFRNAESLVRQIRKDVQEAELVLQGL